jgi:hypothetical protein
MESVRCPNCQSLQRRVHDVQAEIDRLLRQLDEAIRFGVILRKVWGGSRTWVGAQAQAVLTSVWRTCWQQGRCALDFLSQLLRGTPVALALPP